MREEDRKRIDELVDQMECPKGFKCAESGFESLCKARDFGNEHYIICLEKTYPACPFAIAYGFGHETRFCRCPLRVYLAQNLGK